MEQELLTRADALGLLMELIEDEVSREDFDKGSEQIHIFLKTLSSEGEDAELDGIYSGNPKRSTPRPTTERMLNAFEGINLVIFPIPDQDEQAEVPLRLSTTLTDWSPVHERILAILGLQPSLYSSLQSF